MIKLELTPQDLDLIAMRLTAGTMEFNVAMAVAALLAKIQQQANAKPAPTPQPEK